MNLDMFWVSHTNTHVLICTNILVSLRKIIMTVFLQFNAYQIVK